MADKHDQRESAFQRKASVAFSSRFLSSECANVWFVGLRKACCLQFQVWLTENMILIQSLLVALYDVLGPPTFQRSPRILPSWMSQTPWVVFISSIYGIFKWEVLKLQSWWYPHFRKCFFRQTFQVIWVQYCFWNCIETVWKGTVKDALLKHFFRGLALWGKGFVTLFTLLPRGFTAF